MHATQHLVDDICIMPPSPKLRRRLDRQFRALKREAAGLLAPRLTLREQDRIGFNDGLVRPGTTFPAGTPALVARRAALERAPLRGTVRVLVVVVDFADRALKSSSLNRLKDLFFSEGVLPHGSVREYYNDVTRHAIRIDGEVVGPFRMPRPISDYAGSQNGTQSAQPNARTLAEDAFQAAKDSTDFGPYDNDGNGYVDAFIVVHAGHGAEETGAPGDIWSHKWVLPSAELANGVSTYGYLTIPEDAKLGVCAHELGHLLFGWPDLYDTDYTSSGIGGYCLMASGSWGLGGNRPTHPSAWCKANQGWAQVVSRKRNGTSTLRDVKDGGRVYRLWQNGTTATEYFLLENRQRTGYDESLPAGGLFIWHVDDSLQGNTNEAHYRVALVQADGKQDLEGNRNEGDPGDTWPGATKAVTFDDSSTPNSRSYAGNHTCVTVDEIQDEGPAMKVRMRVNCADAGTHATVPPPPGA